MNRQAGFTLVELMITIAIAAVLLGLGVPSFRSIIEANRMTTVSNDVVSSLQFARSEAVRRGEAVEVCASNDQATCSGTWADGWIVQRAVGGVIRVWPAPRQGVAIAGNTVQFNALGGVAIARCYRVTLGALERRVDAGAAGRIVSAVVPPAVSCP